ncbi:MAG: glycosyltransferase family 2 protein [Planctomycetaceae bacterium]|nr:MAG: glycosyltransferase family 2 protein [Planctomycetaceae bacterium]
MYSLSCCIIVKNEAHRLTSLLKSLSPVCEQIVVVDTGSEDNTIQVAKDMGAEVSFFPWNDSFSCARNKSLKEARNPWILYVDADDLIPDNSLFSIAELKKNPPEKAFAFVIQSTQDGITGISSAQIRMFPNALGLEFKYRVHEQIRPALMEKGIPIIFKEINIIHTGYTDQSAVTAKQKRNIKLLEEDLMDYPDDGFLHYMAAMAWLDLKKYASAKEAFLKAWELSIAAPDKRHLALGAALELVELGLKKEQILQPEVMTWLEKAEDIEKNYPRCLYLRGRLAYEENDMSNSLKSLNSLMDCQMPDLLLPININMLKTVGAALMSQIYIKTGRPKDAISILNKVEQILNKTP